MPDYKELGLDQNMRALSSLSNSAYLTERDFKQYIDDRVRNVRRPGGLDFQAVKNTSLGYQAVVGKDNTGGAFTDIQDAINYVSSVGGGNIFIRQGTYVVSSDISFDSNINLFGEGFNNTLIDLNSTRSFVFESVNNSSIRNMTISNSKGGTIAGYGVFGLIRISGTSENLSFSGLRINQSTSNNTSYSVSIVSNNVNNININGNQFSNVGGIFYGVVTAFNKSINLFNNVIGTNVNTCIDLTNSIVDKIEIRNNTFRGCKEKVLLTFDSVCSFNHNNIFISSGTSDSYDTLGVYAEGYAYLDGNRFESNSDTSGTTKKIIHVGGASSAIGNTILVKDNQIGIESSGYGIVVGNYISETVPSGTTVGIETTEFSGTAIIVGNSVSGLDTPILKTGGTNLIKNNGGYVIDNNGLGTVGATTTVGTVTHGLYSTPSVVNITPRNSLGSASNFFTSSIGATTFLINTNTAPGTAVVFSWTAEV